MYLLLLISGVHKIILSYSDRWVGQYSETEDLRVEYRCGRTLINLLSEGKD
jgi:hypothetical protein